MQHEINPLYVDFKIRMRRAPSGKVKMSVHVRNLVHHVFAFFDAFLALTIRDEKFNVCCYNPGRFSVALVPVEVFHI